MCPTLFVSIVSNGSTPSKVLNCLNIARVGCGITNFGVLGARTDVGTQEEREKVF